MVSIYQNVGRDILNLAISQRCCEKSRYLLVEEMLRKYVSVSVSFGSAGLTQTVSYQCATEQVPSNTVCDAQKVGEGL